MGGVVLMSCFPRLDTSGGFIGFVQIAKDITKHKHIEEQNKKLSCAIEQSPVTVVITDTEANIEYVNSKFYQLTGYTEHEVTGQNPRILKTGNTSPEEYKEMWKNITSGGEWSGDFCNKKKSGQIYWENAKISSIKNSKGIITNFIAIKEDITERKKAEGTLKDRVHDLGERHKELGGLYALSELINQTGVSLENILQRAVKLIPHSWQYPDITCGRITFEGMEFKTDNFKQTKWLQSADIIVDKNKVGALEVCYLQEKPECDEGPFLKEEVDLINAFVQQLGLFIENMQAVNNIKHLASFPQLNVNPILEIDYTGKVVFNNDAAVNTLNMLSVENDLALFIPGNFTKIVKSLKEGETVQYYTEVEIGDLLFAETIHLVDDFQVLRIYARDITAWHEVTEKLKLSEKMASLGQLTSGVFHELLNPVNIISSHIQLLLMDAERGSKTESDLKSIQEEISRIVKISDGLLRFARKGNSSREIVNINDLLEKTISIVEPDMKLDNVKFDRELDISLPRIAVDSDEMRQVFLNLITNARDAMPEGGTITVQTQTVQRGYECHLRIPNPEHKGYYIEISFEDTGCGIEKSKVEMVFDPFYTSKEVGKGTGLGLNTSYNIITQHGGMLSVKSEVGKGQYLL